MLRSWDFYNKIIYCSCSRFCSRSLQLNLPITIYSRFKIHIFTFHSLKEQYRMARKKIFSKITDLHKLTQFNDDDSRKHKYFCLKCHIWWELNKTDLPLGVYCSMSVLFIFCFESMSCKMCNHFLRYFLVDQDGRSISNFYILVRLCFSLFFITGLSLVILRMCPFHRS